LVEKMIALVRGGLRLREGVDHPTSL
jgi:hypothetical protein